MPARDRVVRFFAWPVTPTQDLFVPCHYASARMASEDLRRGRSCGCILPANPVGRDRALRTWRLTPATLEYPPPRYIMLLPLGLLAFIAALAFTWWYSKSRRPSVVLVAGVLYLLAGLRGDLALIHSSARASSALSPLLLGEISPRFASGRPESKGRERSRQV